MTPDRPARQVPCPECGEVFSPRGISAHRRMRHGAAPAAVVELGTTLGRIAEVLERLESRLDAAAERASDPQPDGRAAADPVEPPPALPSPPSRSTELVALERGLREVLTEIARVKEETERRIASWAGRAATEEERALEQTTYQRLGTLRRRQASLLFRLQEARGEDAIDNSLCL